MKRTLCLILTAYISLNLMQIEAQINETGINEVIDSEFFYELLFEFTGVIDSPYDSVFTVSCIIDSTGLVNKKTLVIKTFDSKSLPTKTINQDLDQAQFINKGPNSYIKIELGKASPELSRIEIYVIDDLGNSVQLKNQK